MIPKIWKKVYPKWKLHDQIMLLSTLMKGYTNLFIYATKDLLESFNTIQKNIIHIIKHYYFRFFKIILLHTAIM